MIVLQRVVGFFFRNALKHLQNYSHTHIKTTTAWSVGHWAAALKQLWVGYLPQKVEWNKYQPSGLRNVPWPICNTGKNMIKYPALRSYLKDAHQMLSYCLLTRKLYLLVLQPIWLLKHTHLPTVSAWIQQTWSLTQPSNPQRSTHPTYEALWVPERVESWDVVFQNGLAAALTAGSKQSQEALLAVLLALTVMETCRGHDHSFTQFKSFFDECRINRMMLGKNCLNLFYVTLVCVTQNYRLF